MVLCFEIICDGELGYGDSSKPLHERSSGGKAGEEAKLPPAKACHDAFLQLCP